MRTFLDTNVFVYAEDHSVPSKRREAQAIIEQLASSGEAVISTQILQEYFAVATRKLKMTPEQARARVRAMLSLETVRIDPELIMSAIDLSIIARISSWDALLVAAARTASCSRILTEDLADNQVIEGVRIENPFR